MAMRKEFIPAPNDPEIESHPTKYEAFVTKMEESDLIQQSTPYEFWFGYADRCTARGTNAPRTHHHWTSSTARITYKKSKNRK